MPNTHSTLTSLFTDIANAIRAKKGTSADIVADNFPSEIASIPSGGITPSGKKLITDTSETDVAEFATAQISSDTLLAENIKKDVNILGVIGSFEGGGLPSGITDIKTGTFTVAEAVTSYTVTHGGATYPNAFLCILENPVNRNNSENYSLVMYYYQGFSRGTTGQLSAAYTGYMHTSISSGSNLLRGGNTSAYGATSSTKVEMSAGSGVYFKPTIKNRITTEIEPAVYRWYAIW